MDPAIGQSPSSAQPFDCNGYLCSRGAAEQLAESNAFDALVAQLAAQQHGFHFTLAEAYAVLGISALVIGGVTFCIVSGGLGCAPAAAADEATIDVIIGTTAGTTADSALSATATATATANLAANSSVVAGYAIGDITTPGLLGIALPPVLSGVPTILQNVTPASILAFRQLMERLIGGGP